MQAIGVTIDGKSMEVPPGTSILEAAELAGIFVPALCHLKGHPPAASCGVCVVSEKSRGLLPSCAVTVEPGMEIETATEEVLALRRAALNLLLSDHQGDCEAPCARACPAGLSIPRMIRALRRGEAGTAYAVLQESLALPRLICRLCPAPCEKACRRGDEEDPIAVRELVLHIADEDPPKPLLPKVTSGHKVAVVGAGPAGLSAAYQFAIRGVQCTVVDKEDCAGGSLRAQEVQEALPTGLLDQQMDQLAAWGIEWKLDCRVGDNADLEALLSSFDAVLLALGEMQPEELAAGEPALRSMATSNPRLFNAGWGNRARGSAARAAGRGRRCALLVEAALKGDGKPYEPSLFQSRRERSKKRKDPAEQHSRPCISDTPSAREEARRCLDCDCLGASTCALRAAASAAGTEQRRYAGVLADRGPLQAGSRISYDPGKCILCGRCVRITREHSPGRGPAFLGRGFEVRVAVPFEGTVDEAFAEMMDACIRACPTAALAYTPGGGPA